MGLFDFYKQKNEMNLNFIFNSSDHLRYENGKHISGPHGGASRAIKVEPNINGNEGCTVTIFNTDNQNVVQMAPKQMKVIQQTDDKIVLRGYGFDLMGAPFSDYGMTFLYKSGKIEKCVLHMHDRNVDIEYLKSEKDLPSNVTQKETGLSDIQSFVKKWNNETPMNTKISIAQKTDELNNIGCDYHNQNDYRNAIIYFKKALDIMPINDDALKNLVVCYKAIGNFEKMQEAQSKLDYLKKIGI